MAFNPLIFLHLLLLSAYFDPSQAYLPRESQFFDVMKKSLSGTSLSNWPHSQGTCSFCNYTGISCDDQENIIEIDISGWSLSGKFPEDICSYLPKLRVLRIGNNNFNGEFPRGIVECSFLEELDMSSLYYTGSLPDFSKLKALRVLDLSHNLFSGHFPMSMMNLTNLEVLNFNENKELNLWELPENISMLTKLNTMVLTSCMLRGEILASVGNMTSLIDLELSGNDLTGRVPKELGRLKNLQYLQLDYNQLEGQIPEELGNLTELRNLDMSDNKFNSRIPESICRLPKLEAFQLYDNSHVGEIPDSVGNMTSLIYLGLSGNYLTGRVPEELGRLNNLQVLSLYYNQLKGQIPEELGNLTELRVLDMSVNKFNGRIPGSVCLLPNVEAFQLYKNSLVGEIPAVIANSTTLSTLSLYGNFLSGEVPQNLGRLSVMVAVELSENRLSGRLPEGLCSGGKLNYLLVLQNMFSGEIPESYAECKSLVRFRVSRNNLQGRLPEGILSLPHAWIVDVAYNNLTGSIPRDIHNARNLSELFMQENRISGVIPPEISLATNLVKIDLSNNLLSGPIPSEIGNLRLLNLLLLQGNKLDSSIPESLSSLKSINVLDLSRNRLTGNVPESLGELLPNSLNFSDNQLSGPIPLPFVKGRLLESFSGNPDLCVPAYLRPLGPNFPICSQTYNRKKINYIWIIAVSVGIVVLGTILFWKTWFDGHKEVMKNDDTLSYDVKSFHRLSFGQQEILEAMVDRNIVGQGGSGTVYKIDLNNGEVVAVKKLCSRRAKDQLILDKELKAEVETLGSIRHRNIVKLYCYVSGPDFNLLVYEYMSKGNLWDALHHRQIVLDWPTRHKIALGIAQGLAYLHHDLMRPIIHRDIKSTNILLNDDYQPKVADFGIAKVLQARGSKDYSTTVIAGTYGYLAPEYAYSSKVTAKCDVYSFGVVLMELITGKKPLEAEFGVDKNITYWVSSKVKTEEGMIELLDKRIIGLYKNDMIKTLHVAVRCTCRTPALRPTMNEVFQLLIDL